VTALNALCSVLMSVDWVNHVVIDVFVLFAGVDFVPQVDAPTGSMAMVDSSAPAVLLDLPHNVLDMIFGFCDHKSALAVLPMVCQNWEANF